MIQGAAAPVAAIFIAQLMMLVLVGRLLGELAQRLGQPAVIGQLLAGIMLGPSVLGALWPVGQHWLFPAAAAQRGMLDAVAQLGVLMLLLLTGMETNLGIVHRVRGAAVSVSLFGIGLPFIGGCALGWLLPATLLPAPGSRLLTALFLGTALSISSVKIVATVIRQLDFTHRRVGQVLLASAVLDDTLGWIILAVVFGLARHGTIDLGTLGKTVAGAALFLTLSFALGRRAVAVLIRWANDHLRSEMAVVTMILLIMGGFALATNALGLHTALGAFVAGMLIGQSPILTAHIDAQLRGLITALFMPVFFGLAGLSADLGVLRQPALYEWAVAFILVASVGKFGGALLGGRLGGLTMRESLAVGCGMNARGSTEVIIATLGLAMGALTPALFTLVVTMAIVTTLIMPPTLRAALQRIPLTADEKRRLDQQAFDRESYVSRLERLLIAVDESASGRVASHLAGLLAGARGMPTTLVPLKHTRKQATHAGGVGVAVVAAAARARATTQDDADSTRAGISVQVARASGSPLPQQAIALQAGKGFGLFWIGVEPAVHASGAIHDEVSQAVAGFDGNSAIVFARGALVADRPEVPLNMLLAVTGTAYSSRAADVALALAHASAGQLTALYVDPEAAARRWPLDLGGTLRSRLHGAAVLREVVERGRHYGVAVSGRVRYQADAARAILKELKEGQYDLLVMGVTTRSGDDLFFGPVPSAVLAGSPESLLLIAT
jgi:Kef-type K+ transport system membrane component KefB/nucleotide-binding universal stress UspA family protein